MREELVDGPLGGLSRRTAEDVAATFRRLTTPVIREALR
jgi:hypothetical protein